MDILEGLKLEGKRVVRKVAAFIIQPNRKEILAFLSVPGVPYRFVGGNIEKDEGVVEALFREIEEESGLRELTTIRKIGIQRYYKAFIDANVERHDYLLMPAAELPERWDHTGTGGGGDDGLVFQFKWLKTGDLEHIDPEFRDYVNRELIPELYD